MNGGGCSGVEFGLEPKADRPGGEVVARRERGGKRPGFAEPQRTSDSRDVDVEHMLIKPSPKPKSDASTPDEDVATPPDIGVGIQGPQDARLGWPNHAAAGSQQARS